MALKLGRKVRLGLHRVVLVVVLYTSEALFLQPRGFRLPSEVDQGTGISDA
jgi:hypothetical protein